jgi:hypothetical protein
LGQGRQVEIQKKLTEITEKRHKKYGYYWLYSLAGLLNYFGKLFKLLEGKKELARICNQRVGGSNPSVGSNKKSKGLPHGGPP